MFVMTSILFITHSNRGRNGGPHASVCMCSCSAQYGNTGDVLERAIDASDSANVTARSCLNVKKSIYPQ